jgi:hypothetical protein
MVVGVFVAVVALCGALAYDSHEAHETQRACIRAGGTWSRNGLGDVIGCHMPPDRAREPRP